MLHLAKKVIGAPVRGTDGNIGTLADYFFEEDRWTIRYLLIDAAEGFKGKRVLVSPMAVRTAWGVSGIELSLTRDEVWNSPQVTDDEALSATGEADVLAYYGYPEYWGATGVWGSYDNPTLLGADRVEPVTGRSTTRTATIDPEARRLRSVAKSAGYHIHAQDGEIGHVDDFLIGQDSWRIRYLLVDTSNWIGGRSVIVSSDLLDHVDKTKGQLYVNAMRAEISNAPAFKSIEAALDLRETGPPFTFV
jgi:hypothetical protein